MAPLNDSLLSAILPDNWTSHTVEAASPKVSGDVVQGALLVAIALLGICMNLFLLLAILPNPRMRSVRQVLLVHLGFVGLVTSLVLTLPAGVLQLVFAVSYTPHTRDVSSDVKIVSTVTASMPGLSESHNVLREAPVGFLESDIALEETSNLLEDVRGLQGGWCTAVGVAGVLLTSAGVWTVAALAWDKHRAIAAPLHHPLVAKRLTMTAWLASLWGVAAALALPPVMGGGDYRFVPALWMCSLHAGSAPGRWHSLLVVLLGVVAPLALMLYCYAHIFRIARAQSSRIAATMLRMVTLIQAPIAPPPARSASSVMRLRGTRAMATIVQLVGSCVASYVPWAALLLHQAITEVPPAGLLASTAAVLLHAAPLTAATVYGLRNSNLRTSFFRFVSRRLQRLCHVRRRRRPSLKSLTRNSSALYARKVPIQNGVGSAAAAAAAATAAGMRRTCSLQAPGRHGEQLKLDDIALPRPHSYNVLTPREHPRIDETVT